MKKYILLFVFLLCGCSSFGKGVANALLDRQKEEDLRVCEVRGQEFEGVDYFFSKGNTVKVMMIHGVGTHVPGYSARLQDNLSKTLGLDVVYSRPKIIDLISPVDDKTPIGTLKVTRYQNKEDTKDMIFYELTWSVISQKEKEIISYDSSKLYAYKRAAFNQSMKKFLNDTAPDPLTYLSDKKGFMLDSLKQADCWLLGYDWDALPSSAKEVCKISNSNQITNLKNEKVIFITHSLGSKLLVDALEDIVVEVKNHEKYNDNDSKAILNALKDNKFLVFMMANQLPILQIGSPIPDVVGQYDEYCLRGGKNYNQRVFGGVNIVAFSDPNDILSYDIPQKFVDKYLDSRMCPMVTNVNINIATEISAFGLGVVNPLAAHVDYDNDERVVELMAHGINPQNRSKIVSDKCKMTYTK